MNLCCVFVYVFIWNLYHIHTDIAYWIYICKDGCCFCNCICICVFYSNFTSFEFLQKKNGLHTGPRECLQSANVKTVSLDWIQNWQFCFKLHLLCADIHIIYVHALLHVSLSVVCVRVCTKSSCATMPTKTAVKVSLWAGLLANQGAFREGQTHKCLSQQKSDTRKNTAIYFSSPPLRNYVLSWPQFRRKFQNIHGVHARLVNDSTNLCPGRQRRRPPAVASLFPHSSWRSTFDLQAARLQQEIAGMPLYLQMWRSHCEAKKWLKALI